MTSLNFNVKGQKLTRGEADFLANDSMNILTLKATFDTVWDGFSKYAIFSYKGEHYASIPTYHEGYYEFTVPSEVLKGKVFYFTIVGYTTENEEVITRITTNSSSVRLYESGFTDDLKNAHFEEVDEATIETLFSVFYTKAEIDALMGDCEDLLGGG